MKKLILIGGTMGVGKTTTARILRDQLENSVLLDGDWCWDMHPFQVTEETKAMVMDNICHLLNNFLGCSSIDNVVFCWVMHEQAIIEEILSRLHEPYQLHSISLVCSAERLAEWIERDVAAGLRCADAIDRSIARLPLYAQLNTVKIDVSEITPEEAAHRIAGLWQDRCSPESAK